MKIAYNKESFSSNLKIDGLNIDEPKDKWYFGITIDNNGNYFEFLG